MGEDLRVEATNGFEMYRNGVGMRLVQSKRYGKAIDSSSLVGLWNSKDKSRAMS